MRISTQQIEQLIQAITPFIDSYPAELRLYGSRLDSNRKGGDIDLLLLVEPTQVDLINEKKHHLLAQIKKYLGDQKIDLLIADSTGKNNPPFLNMILPESVCLKQWP